MSAYGEVGKPPTALATTKQQTPTQGPEKQAGMFQIPLEYVNKVAKMYMQYKPMIKWLGPMAGFKIPKELDDFLTGVATGEPVTEEQVQQFTENMDVQPRVGEPVMTFKMARDAWMMHNEGMSLRDIAEEFTKQGNPVSHATIARWYNEYDDQYQADKYARYRGRLLSASKWILSIAAFVGWTLILKFWL